MSRQIKKNIMKVFSIALILSFVTANFSYSLPLCSMQVETGSCCCSSEAQNTSSHNTSQESFSKVCCCETIEATANYESVPVVIVNNLIVKKDYSSNDNYSIVNLAALTSFNKTLTDILPSQVLKDIYLINSNLRI